MSGACGTRRSKSIAFRRGHGYGTIIIDLDSHRPIDVPPDRDPVTLRVYLTDHPEVEVISQDRDAPWAEDIAWKAPPKPSCRIVGTSSGT